MLQILSEEKKNYVVSSLPSRERERATFLHVWSSWMSMQLGPNGKRGKWGWWSVIISRRSGASLFLSFLRISDYSPLNPFRKLFHPKMMQMICNVILSCFFFLLSISTTTTSSIIISHTVDDMTVFSWMLFAFITWNDQLEKERENWTWWWWCEKQTVNGNFRSFSLRLGFLDSFKYHPHHLSYADNAVLVFSHHHHHHHIHDAR